MKFLFTLGSSRLLFALGASNTDVTSVNGIVKSANVDGWIET